MVIGSAIWSYNLIKFGWKTVQTNLVTPILGVEKDSYGLYVDKSDIQWNSFIENIELLLTSAIAFLILSKIIKSATAHHKTKFFLMAFNILMGLAMYIYMFRGGIIFWLFFSLFNLVLVSLFAGTKVFPLLIWGFNIFLIFIFDRYQGFNLVDFFHTDLL